jgi:hypothetical protein
MKKPNLNLKRYGWVNGEILWSHNHLIKITFKQGFFKRRVTEVFHIKEIMNFNDIFIDKHHKITSINS